MKVDGSKTELEQMTEIAEQLRDMLVRVLAIHGTNEFRPALEQETLRAAARLLEEVSR